MPPPAELRIARYPGEPNVYLLYLDGEGREVTDTYHESVAAAQAQAEWEFGITAAEWDPETP